MNSVGTILIGRTQAWRGMDRWGWKLFHALDRPFVSIGHCLERVASARVEVR